MSEKIQRETLLAILGGDAALLERMVEAGLLPADDLALTPEHAETARVVYTLVHELEVNWPGVEVVVHMRSELVATRQQIVRLVEFVRHRGAQDEHGGH